jgi:Domain of unknown function (DUF4326)
MSTPKRIQRLRSAGWRRPPNTVIVDRTSDFGNPFTIKEALEAGYGETEEQARAFVVRSFRYWLEDDPDWGRAYPKQRVRLLERLPELVGKDVACTCPPTVPCHGDVLLLAAARLVVA